jgi:hypothetical protein
MNAQAQRNTRHAAVLSSLVVNIRNTTEEGRHTANILNRVDNQAVPLARDGSRQGHAGALKLHRTGVAQTLSKKQQYGRSVTQSRCEP